MAGYTDYDLIVASQVAYNEEISRGYQALALENPGRTSFTIQECIEKALSSADPTVGAVGGGESPLESYLASHDGQGYIRQAIENGWSIGCVYDNNSGSSPRNAGEREISGFYACIIETNADHSDAIIAYRGSENLNDVEQLQLDWMQADLGLLNSTETNQYRDAEDFLEINKVQISRYNSVELTGHSLGGNLAEFSMIIAARHELGDNFIGCKSLDGPGFSKEFLKEYSPDIEAVQGKLHHVKWSFVGSMLYSPPGEDTMFGKVKDDFSAYSKAVTRHDMKYLDLDENGMIKEGNQDLFAFLSQSFSRLMDTLPKPIGDLLIKGLSHIVMYAAHMSFPEKIFWGLVFVIKLPAVVKIVGVVLLMYGVYLGYEYLTRIWDDLVEGFRKMVADVWQWATDKINDFVAAIVKLKDSILENFREMTRAGKRAAAYLSDHRVIRLHTDDLRALAERIDAVNRRLSSVDDRLNGLYRLAKISDLGALLKTTAADMKICYSTRLRKCAEYLVFTAEQFETAEQQLSGMLNG